jgi:hypothetical protein
MSTTAKRSRQQRALAMLENTLHSGVKLSKDGSIKLALTDHDKVRINQECVTLKMSIAKG